MSDNDSDCDSLRTPPRRLPSYGSDVYDFDEASSHGMASMKGLPRTIPKDACKRVDKVDPGGRCLVENVSPHRGVGYVHCFPGRFHDVKHESLLTTLEYHWGMRKFDLNLDTRQNIFRLGASVHRIFENNQWTLIPEEPHVIKAFLDSLEMKNGVWKPVRAKFPKFEQTRFKYRLIPLPQYMEEVTFSHQNSEEIPTQPSDVIIHIYPFHTLPTFESHLHPKFVVLETGRKLENIIADVFEPMIAYVGKAVGNNVLNLWVDGIRAQWPVVRDIERIYKAWTTEPEFRKIDWEPDFNNDNQSTRIDNRKGTGRSKTLIPEA